MSTKSFDEAAKGLPFLPPDDLDAQVVEVEPIDAEYFRNEGRRQRCIVRRGGRLFVSWYD